MNVKPLQVLMLILFAPLGVCFSQTASLQDTEAIRPQLTTSYDSAMNRTTVRLLPIKISGEKAQYHSIHIAPSYSYVDHTFKKPEIVDFEVQTIVKTRLKIDLYVVFVVDGETIFLSSNRSAVKRPTPGKRWVGERLVFRMPYDTLMKLVKAKSVEIKMDGIRFPLSEAVMEHVREFAQRLDT